MSKEKQTNKESPKKEEFLIVDDVPEIVPSQDKKTKPFPESKLDFISLAAKLVADVILPVTSKGLFGLIFPPSKREKKTLEDKKVELVKSLVGSGVDLKTFDSLISSELNRRLKVRFGVTFLTFTFLFTLASYLIVILDAINQWNISETAITALIIETPIQFIGLLYIIARNLFPQSLTIPQTK